LLTIRQSESEATTAGMPFALYAGRGRAVDQCMRLLKVDALGVINVRPRKTDGLRDPTSALGQKEAVQLSRPRPLHRRQGDAVQAHVDKSITTQIR
jgi:hypothetical protein